MRTRSDRESKERQKEKKIEIEKENTAGEMYAVK